MDLHDDFLKLYRDACHEAGVEPLDHDRLVRLLLTVLWQRHQMGLRDADDPSDMSL